MLFGWICGGAGNSPVQRIGEWWPLCLGRLVAVGVMEGFLVVGGLLANRGRPGRPSLPVLKSLYARTNCRINNVPLTPYKWFFYEKSTPVGIGDVPQQRNNVCAAWTAPAFAFSYGEARHS